MQKKLLRRVVVAAVAALIPSAVVTLGSGTAQAITGGPSAPETVPASPSPQWQTNNSVWALAYSNHVLYAAGDFTAILSPNGATSIPMSGIAAFHADEANPALN